MGRNVHKVEYDCDCCDHSQQGYACSEKNAFIMVLLRSTDYWKLFHRTHKDGELFVVDSFTDGQIGALQEMFKEPGKHSADDGVFLTEREMREIDEKLFK